MQSAALNSQRGYPKMEWSGLNKHEKAAEIRRVYEPGMSAAQIAAFFRGATRQSIIGLYHRTPDLRKSHPLLDPTSATRAHQRKRAPRQLRAPTRIYPPAPKPEPKPVPIYEGALNLALEYLNRGMCYWPMNDGGPFLFCGCASSGKYCDYHSLKAVRVSVDRDASAGENLAYAGN